MAAALLLALTLAAGSCARDAGANSPIWDWEKAIKKTIPDSRLESFRAELNQVQFWLREHKYNELDRRRAENARQPYFHRSFPEPRLKELVRPLSQACEKGVDECVKHIFLRFTRTVHHQRQANSSYVAEISRLAAASTLASATRIATDPFASLLDKFRFMTTGSYYMCFYALQRASALNGSQGDECRKNGVYYNPATLEIRSKWESADYRMDDGAPFSCALLSFCPDVCCGGYSAEPSSELACQQFPGNPCYGIDEGSCRVDAATNRNFADMMRNRINASCDCDKQRAGFRWSSSLGRCVDDDECADAGQRARLCGGVGEACQNTIGSYACVCGWGYAERTGPGGCVEDGGLGFTALEIGDRVRQDGPSGVTPLTDRQQPASWGVRFVRWLNGVSARAFDRAKEGALARFDWLANGRDGG